VTASRLLLWALVPLTGLGAAVAVASGSADAAVVLGRERLLAGDAADAAAAFGRARPWPSTRRLALAGAEVAARLEYRTSGAVADPAAVLELQPAFLLEAALARGDLEGARLLAGLALRASDPLGTLYAAALALDAGDVDTARSLAGESRVPLAAREAGRRLEEGLALEASGARRLVRDRNGLLVGSVDASGAFATAADVEAGLLQAPLLEAIAAQATAPRFDGLRLGLDLSLSRLAREALGDHRGSIVLLEPHSGAVLAAVSDARTARREGAAAFTQRREPASIAKLITTAATYRAGIDADAEIRGMSCDGVERYGGEPLWCPSPGGPLQGLDYALAISCNVAFGNLATLVGAPRLLQEFRIWGFDAEPPALLGSAGHILRPPRRPLELAELGIGLELTDITPLHAALLAATVANDGRMPEPRLVTGGCGPLGLSDAPEPAGPGRAILDPATLAALRQAMSAVALYGTGAGLAPPGFPIAMKTGTAAAWRVGYHVNYVGFAPAARPSIAFCVRLTHQPTSWRVNQAARGVTRQLLQGLARRAAALQRAAARQQPSS